MAEEGTPQNVYHVHVHGGAFVAGDHVQHKSEIAMTGEVMEESGAVSYSGQTESDRVTRDQGQRPSSVPEPKKDEKDLAWVSEGKIALYKKRRLSSGWNSQVFYGKQQLLPNLWREVAIKLIEHREKNMNELALLINLHHTNIVQMFDAGVIQGSMVDYIYVVMELCSQNLRSYIKENPFDFLTSLSFSKQLATGLAYLHDNGIVHRDLKPDNILISFCKKFLKLSDFGISKQIRDDPSDATVTKLNVGTEGYRSPETYVTTHQPDMASPSLDIFPYGLVVNFIFTNGKHPFGSNPNDWSYNIRNNKKRDLSLIPVFARPNHHKREQLIHLLDQAMKHDPKDRPTAQKVLQHVVFRDGKPDTVGAPSVLKKDKEDKTNDQSNEDTDLKSLDLQELSNSLENLRMVESEPTETSIVIIDREANYLQRINLEDKTLTNMQEMHDDMKFGRFSAVSIDDHIYVLIGLSLHRIMYRDAKATWEQMADLNEYHGSDPPAVAVSGSIYVAGSGYWDGSTNAVTRYDPLFNRWQKLKKKVLVTSGAAVVASKGFIYCMGGTIVDEGSATNRVERMEIVSQAWEEIPPMKEERAELSAVECGGSIIVAGGRSFAGVSLNTAEKFNSATNQWTRIKGTIRARYLFRCHAIDGNVYAVGGDHIKSDSRLRIIEKYYPTESRWKVFLALETTINIDESVIVEMKA